MKHQEYKLPTEHEAYQQRQTTTKAKGANKTRTTIQRKYQKDKLEQEIIEKYYELQQEKELDLHTGDITQTEYNKLVEKMHSKLAHLHLVS